MILLCYEVMRAFLIVNVRSGHPLSDTNTLEKEIPL